MRRILSGFLMALACSFIAACCYAGELGSDPKAMVDIFFKADFEGDCGIRMDYVHYNPRREAEIRKKEGEYYSRGKKVASRLFQVGTSPIVVVSTYTVRHMDVFQSRGTVSVEYFQLARTRGNGSMKVFFIKDIREHDVITYQMRKVDGIWFVYDPPLPRVSIDVAKKGALSSRLWPFRTSQSRYGGMGS